MPRQSEPYLPDLRTSLLTCAVLVNIHLQCEFVGFRLVAGALGLRRNSWYISLNHQLMFKKPPKLKSSVQTSPRLFYILSGIS